MKRRLMLKNFRTRYLIVILTAVGVIALTFLLVNIFPKPLDETAGADSELTTSPTKAVVKKKTPKATATENRVKLLAVGDMLMHVPVSGYARQADGSYNYDFIFEPILKELGESDLAVLNNEVPFGGNQIGLRGYPSFNCFTELGDAEVKAGFNVILNASNHVNDMGYAGIQNTLKFWEKYPDVTLLGLNKTPSDVGKLTIVEVNNIKIALFNFTYGINAGSPKDAPYIVDLMTDATLPQIREELMRAEQEADFTIVFPHWGEEYHLVQSTKQERYAKLFTEWGADLIIGAHPHCIEPIRTIEASNGNQSLCYYSLGNFISEQDETIAMIGGIAKVEIVKDKNGARIDKHDIQFVINHFGQEANAVKLYRLEDYSDELAAQHGIVLNQWNGGELNLQYPFNMASINAIIANMKSDHPQETQLTHVEQRWGTKKTQTTEENTTEKSQESSTEPPETSDTPIETSSESPETSTEPPETSTEPPETSTEPPETSTEPSGSSEPPV